MKRFATLALFAACLLFCQTPGVKAQPAPGGTCPAAGVGAIKTPYGATILKGERHWWSWGLVKGQSYTVTVSAQKRAVLLVYAGQGCANKVTLVSGSDLVLFAYTPKVNETLWVLVGGVDATDSYVVLVEATP